MMYVWNFSDGTVGSSTTPEIDHLYAVGGIYTVKLKTYVLTSDGKICECEGSIDYEIDVPEPDCQGEKVISLKSKSIIVNKKFSAIPAFTPKSENITVTAKPNPFSRSLSVSIKQTINDKALKGVYTLAFLDANGSTLTTKSISANSITEINTATYPAGIYLLVLKGTDGKTESTRVVKINQ